MNTAVSSSIGIMILDDHDVVRLGLTALLSKQPDLAIIGSFATTTELLAALEVRVPDVLLVDLGLGADDMDGLELIPQVVEYFPRCRVLVLSVEDTPATIARALQLGSTGFANKCADIPELVNAIRRVAKGQRSLPPTLDADSPLLNNLEVAKNTTSKELPPLSSRLSPREREILQDLVEGLTVTEIARKYGRSQTTISTQKQSAFSKLEIRTNGELFKISGLLGLRL